MGYEASDKNNELREKYQYRQAVIVRTGIISILTNIILVLFKAAAGVATNSIAIILDAVNNLSDVASSVITIAGTKIAGKKPDKKHPLGHGRIEYMSALLVASMIIYAGITAAVEAAKKIIHPVDVSYSMVSIIILTVAVIIKLILGIYVKKAGESVNSGSLKASGSDAIFDALVSFSVLLSAIIYIFYDIKLEAYVGVLISVFIVKAGIEMFMDTLDEVLGKRVDSELTKAIKSTIEQKDEVYGAYDLILHNYGPDRYIGSVYIEISENMTAREIDILTRSIDAEIFEKYGVILAGIGIYSLNMTDDKAKNLQNRIRSVVMSHDEVLQLHGFYADMETKTVSFDIIVDFSAKDRWKVYDHILRELMDIFPEYSFNIVMDSDITD